MTSQRGLPSRIAGFAALPAVSLAASLLILPLLARAAGAGGWVAIGVGQAIGSFGAVVIMFGWGLIGPAKLAKADSVERRRIYAESVLSRSLIALPTLPAVATVSYWLSPHEYAAEALVMSASAALGGLSPIWFAIGTGRAGLAASYDLVPRILATVAAAGAIVLTGQIIYYPLALLVSALYCSAAFAVRNLRREDFAGLKFRLAIHRFRDSHIAAITELAGASYSALPILLVTAVAPITTAASYVSGERLYRIGLLAIMAISNAFQGWVVEGASRRARMRTSLITHACLGGAGAAIFATSAPPVSALLFGDQLATDPLTAFWLGIAFAATSVNTSLGRHILIPAGMSKALLLSTFVGAGLGVPTIFIAASLWGSAGGAMGLAVSQVTVCLVQAAALARGRLFPAEA